MINVTAVGRGNEDGSNITSDTVEAASVGASQEVLKNTSPGQDELKNNISVSRKTLKGTLVPAKTNMRPAKKHLKGK
jgi:hypothetical protein